MLFYKKQTTLLGSLFVMVAFLSIRERLRATELRS